MLNQGLLALSAEVEIKELQDVGALPGYKPKRRDIRLQYLKGSEKMSIITNKGERIDCRLWNVLSPKLPGYRYGPDSGVPTLGVDGLKKVKLI
jgi:hypothetical protein